MPVTYDGRRRTRLWTYVRVLYVEIMKFNGYELLLPTVLYMYLFIIGLLRVRQYLQICS